MKKLITHDGCFHTDEVVACMLLSIYYDSEVEIIRTRDDQIIHHTENSIVVDVGKRYDKISRFDHHQYPDGDGYFVKWDDSVSSMWCIPLSSAGMIWKHFGLEICKKLHPNYRSDDEIEKVYQRMYGNFFIEIDGNDNGIDQYSNSANIRKNYNINATLIGTIGRLNSDNTYDSETQMDAFKDAMDFSERMFRIHLNTYYKNQESMKDDSIIMRKYYEERVDDKILIIEQDLKNWRTILRTLDRSESIMFIVYPRETQWGVKTIPKSGFQSRRNLAEESVLRKAIGDELVFLHKKRFICSCRTKEAAIKCAKISLIE